jgi:hypothetical protein
MDLFLFCVFLALSVILIAMGLFRPEHAELSLVGFVFLFLLALLIIGQDIQYKVGSETNVTYNYGVDNVTVQNTTEVSVDHYDTFTAGGSLSHTFGYWLAIASLIGFIGVILSLRRPKY